MPSAAAVATTWPATSDWEAVASGGAALPDPCDDASVAEIALASNAKGATPFYSDAADTTVSTYSTPLAASGSSDAKYAGWEAAGSDVCGGTKGAVDCFLGWRLPWLDLAAATGAAPAAPRPPSPHRPSACAQGLLPGRRLCHGVARASVESAALPARDHVLVYRC